MRRGGRSLSPAEDVDVNGKVGSRATSCNLGAGEVEVSINTRTVGFIRRWQRGTLDLREPVHAADAAAEGTPLSIRLSARQGNKSRAICAASSTAWKDGLTDEEFL